MDTQKQTINPFAQLQEELEAELAYRKSKNDYYIYCQRTIFGFKKTRFHEYLCKKVQEFIEKYPAKFYAIRDKSKSGGMFKLKVEFNKSGIPSLNQVLNLNITSL
jgi:hypothetical protein